MNLQHVVTFYFVAREKSFHAAAEKLFITQPAVTQQIHALEVQFGVKLIHIKKKRAYLTRAGEQLLTYAEELFNQIMVTENYLKSYRLTNINIGIASQLTVLLTGLIDRFKDRQPSVRLSVREASSGVLAEELLNFKHDICFVGPLPRVSERLSMIRIPQAERIVFVASPDYPLSSKEEITWQDLVKYPLIIPGEGSAAREIAFENFRKRDLQPLIGAQVDNIECAKRLVLQKKGIAFMVLFNIRDELARNDLKILNVAGTDIRIDVDILMNPEIALSPVAESFLSLARERFGLNTTAC